MMTKLNEKLAEILEEDIIEDDTDLRQCENMDSLSILAIVAMVDKEFHVNLSVNDIRAISTPVSLMEIIERKRG